MIRLILFHIYTLIIFLVSIPAEANSQACIIGYVWRLAKADDLVCVTPQSRALVAYENQLANSRR